jgi:hypothetical protein
MSDEPAETDLWNMEKSSLEIDAHNLTQEKQLVTTAIQTGRAEASALAGQLTRLKRDLDSLRANPGRSMTSVPRAPAPKGDFGVQRTDTYQAASERRPDGKPAGPGKRRRSSSSPPGVGRGDTAKAGK